MPQDSLLDRLVGDAPIEAWEGRVTPGGIWRIQHGGVEEWRHDVKLAFRHEGDPAHALVGELDHLWHDERKQLVCTAWYALPGTKVQRVSREAFRNMLDAGGPDSVALQALVLAHGRQWRTDAGHTFDAFAWARWHGTAPHAYPPPYEMPNSEFFAIPCLAPAVVVQDLPPCVTPIPMPAHADAGETPLLAMLGFRRSPSIGAATDRPPKGPMPGLSQAMIALPVTLDAAGPDGRRDWGFYVMWGFGNNALSMFLGREVFGVPEMYGSTYRVQNTGVTDEKRSNWRLIGSAGGMRSFDLPLNDAGPEPGGLTDQQGVELTRFLDGLLRPGLPPDHETLREIIDGLASGSLTPQDGAAALGQDLAVQFLGWKRLFSAAAEGGERVAWKASDFNVDGLARSDLAAQVTDLRVVRVPDHTKFELFLTGVDSAREFKLLSGFGFRMLANLTKSGANAPGAPELVVDFKALAASGELTPEMRGRLAWGPAVWGKGYELPRSPLAEKGSVRNRRGPDLLGGSVAEALQRAWYDETGGAKAEIPALLDRLGDKARVELVDAGTILTRPNQKPADVIWLVDGLIDLWRGNQFAGYTEPGELLAMFAPTERGIGLEARVARKSRVLRIDRAVWAKLFETPTWSPIQVYLARLERRTYLVSTLMAVHSLTEATYQFFPGARGQVLPGPYKADSVSQFTIPLRRTRWLEDLLPPRAEWVPGMPALLVFARFKGFASTRVEVPHGASYSECGVLIPCRVEGKPFVHEYIPWIFPTSLMAAFAGREIYGYPKTWGTVVVDPIQQRLVLRRSGTTMLAIGYRTVPGRRLRRVLSGLYGRILGLLPSSLKPNVKAACHKRAYAANANVTDPAELQGYQPALFDVDALVGSAFRVTSLTRADVVRLEHLGIECTIPDGQGGPPTQVTLKTYGLAMHAEYGMTMVIEPGDATLADYKRLVLTPEEQEALSIATSQRVDSGPNSG